LPFAEDVLAALCPLKLEGRGAGGPKRKWADRIGSVSPSASGAGRQRRAESCGFVKWNVAVISQSFDSLAFTNSVGELADLRRASEPGTCGIDSASQIRSSLSRGEHIDPVYQDRG
jgi:hypothetical protein